MPLNTFAPIIMRFIMHEDILFNVYTALGVFLQVLPFLVNKLMYTTECFLFNVSESPKTI